MAGWVDMQDARREMREEYSRMKIVNTKLDGTLSLVDKTWNDAMETAAAHCDDRYKVMCGWDDIDGKWEAAKNTVKNIAAELRATKRGLK